MEAQGGDFGAGLVAKSLLCFLTGYGVGSIPVGLVVGHLTAGIDVRRSGTGNLGASNVLHNVGTGPAAVVGAATFLQGFGPARTAAKLTGSPLCAAAAGVGAAVGYGWSFLLGFEGGSAVGTATGALASFCPGGLAPLLTCYAAGGLLRRPSPLVLLGILGHAAHMVLRPHPRPLAAGSVAVAGVVVARRLHGARRDLRDHPQERRRVLIDRLVYDRRPGQRLTGAVSSQP
jgi:glycerol-3-phosphate acyltransferase PlsY